MASERVRPNPFRSGAFRFAFLLAALFALGSAILLLVVQRQVGAYADEATDASLRSEVAILTGEFATARLPGLIEAMNRRQQVSGEPQFRYLLVNPAGRKIYGDLPIDEGQAGWGRARLHEAGLHSEEGEGEVLKRLGQKLPGGLTLVVATDTFDIENLRDRLFWFTVYSGLGITLFALAGGLLVGQLFLSRLENANAAVRRIIEGDLLERLPSIGISPEFDELSLNVNLMLDRNAALMDGLRQVSTDIAHDLRTPLTRLHQQLQRMRDEGAPPPFASAVEDALAQTETLLGIFQALLRIGAFEGGAGRQRFGWVDLSEVMDRVFLAYRPVAEDAGQSLICEHERDLQVKGDAGLLAQLFTNLIENALVHTPAGTVITSRLASEEGRIHAVISDNGPGVPVEEHAKIFRRFYRRDASRNAPGTGLGLSMVSAIAALHRAQLVVSNRDPGLAIGIDFNDNRGTEQKSAHHPIGSFAQLKRRIRLARVGFSVMVAAAFTVVAVGGASAQTVQSAGVVDQGVVVTGVRPRVRKLPDRTVYSLGQDVQATTGSAADVLNQLPSVEVDVDGNVALRGDSKVTVLVDGKPSAQLSGSAAGLGLQQFPASEIDRIEVMPTPPAEFKATGSGGVINIVTKRSRQAGLSGSGQFSLGDEGRLLANGSLAYGAGPLSLFAGVVLRRDIKQRRVATHRNALDPISGQPVLSDEFIRETLRRLTPLFKAGGDYKLDARTSFGGSASEQELTGHRYFDQLDDSFDQAGVALDRSNRHSDGHEWNKATEEELHLTRKLAREGEELSASLQRSVERERERYAYLNTFTIPETGPTRDDLHLSHDLVTNEARLDYVLPLPHDQTWKAGYDYEGDQNNFDNRGDTVDQVSSALVNDPNITDHFRYRQAIHAVYGSFQGLFGPWTVQTGLRYEHADIAFRDTLAAPESHRSNEGLYPSLHVERALDERQRLTFAIARRINRPDPEALDPFTDYQDTHNLRAGNPDLKPEDVLSYEAGYAFDTKPLSLGLTGYYKFSRNSVTDVTEVVGPDVVLTTKANLPRSRSAGFEMTANGQMGPKLSYNIGANLFYIQIDAHALGSGGLRSTAGLNGKINFDYRPTKLDTLQLAFSRSDRRLTPQGYIDAVNLVNLGYRRQLSPALSLVATVSDALNGQTFTRRISTPTLTQVYQRRQVGQILYLGFTYSFGGGAKAKKSDFEYDNK